MTPETISALVNMGSAGAVIAVVIIFLKDLEKRDTRNAERAKEERSFFLQMRQCDATTLERLANSIQQMAQSMSALTDKLSEHDDRARDGIDAIRNAIGDTKTQPRRKPTA